MEMQDYRGVVAGSVPVHLSRRGAIGLLCAAISTAPGAVASEPAGGKAGTCSSCGGRVDTHAHYLPPAYRAAVADAGLKTVDGGVTLPEWTADRHIEMMDANYIATSILSLSSPGVQFLDGSRMARLARTVNDAGAELVAQYPGRFGLFATLPLPDVEASLVEIDYCFDTLKADGVVLMTNSKGHYPGDPRFERVFEALDRRGAVVYLHPTSPCGFEQYAMGLPTPVIEFPFDTVRAAVNLIYSGVLRRCPRIRLLLSHAGGALPMLASRIAAMSGLPIIEPRPERGAEEFREQLASIYFDVALSANDAAINALLEVAPIEHITFGTDFPFARGPGLEAHFAAFERIKRELGAEAASRIERENALTLFPRLRALLAGAH